MQLFGICVADEGSLTLIGLARLGRGHIPGNFDGFSVGSGQNIAHFVGAIGGHTGIAELGKGGFTGMAVLYNTDNESPT